MTDVCPGGTEWVPRVGLLEVPASRAALIRGLFELAAFVADHPELPLPFVEATGIPVGESFSEDMRTVEAVAEALGVTSAFAADAGYVARRKFGPYVSARWVGRPIPCGIEDAPEMPLAGESR